ncbi:hypothetical protein C8R44DRAFT_873788 [Mycena epipterygia]|nr:hypothetical protein C8R44DRAFT_873788 [Mycena epipterygia]
MPRGTATCRDHPISDHALLLSLFSDDIVLKLEELTVLKLVDWCPITFCCSVSVSLDYAAAAVAVRRVDAATVFVSEHLGSIFARCAARTRSPRSRGRKTKAEIAHCTAPSAVIRYRSIGASSLQTIKRSALIKPPAHSMIPPLCSTSGFLVLLYLFLDDIVLKSSF